MNITADEAISIMRLIADLKQQIDVGKLLVEQYRNERDEYRRQLEERGA